MIIREEFFSGLWQKSYCFPSIVDGELYYSKRNRLVLENLLANEAGNWRLNYYNPMATMMNEKLRENQKWQVVGTTIDFGGVKDRDKYFLLIEVHMTDPWAQQDYRIAVDEYLFSLFAVESLMESSIGPLGFFIDALVAEAMMVIARFGATGMFDTYFFKWSPGNGDYSLLTVPIYRI